MRPEIVLILFGASSDDAKDSNAARCRCDRRSRTRVDRLGRIGASGFERGAQRAVLLGVEIDRVTETFQRSTGQQARFDGILIEHDGVLAHEHFVTVLEDMS